MKRLSPFLFSLLLSSFAYAGNDDEKVKSSITDVTVYMSGAQITQKASYSVKVGITKIIIENISPTIDKNSLQVNASGNVVIIDAKYSIFYPKPEEVSLEGLPLKIRKEIKSLEDSLYHLNFDLQQIQDEIDLYIATKNILANNGSMRGQGKVNDSINLLKQAVDYYLIKVNELNKKIIVLNKQKSDKNILKKEISERLLKLHNYQNDAQLLPEPKGPSHRVVVTLSAKEASTGKFLISYLVGNAGWIPMYDLRADASSESINMNYKAQVFQNTGMNWENVHLSVSTNNPFLNKTLPTLNPWFVNYNNYIQNAPKTKNLELKKESIRYDDSQSAPSQEASEKYLISNSNGIQYDAKTAADYSQVIEHMISAEFKIDLPYTIESNNEQHMVLIRNVDIPAKYRHYSIPKLDPTAYLTAEVYNLTDFQLVPGQANIFFDGTYMGETFIRPNQMEDTITLSLGADPNVMIKRNLAKKECKEKVIGNSKERIMVYDFEIKNLKSTNLDLTIIDQIPVTTNPEIEIEELELSKGKLDDKSGFIEWNLKMKPKESKALSLKYSVKHNKDFQLYL